LIDDTSTRCRAVASGFDFLEPKWSADNIITNPPYNCAESFVASGVKHSNRKFALQVR
jgi:hypothetical protein